MPPGGSDLDGLLDRRRKANRLEREVRTAVGGGPDRRRRLGSLAGDDPGGRAECPRTVDLLGDPVDGHDLRRPGEHRAHDDRQSDAAEAEDHDAASRAGPGPS